ncbi:hypothetical protein BRETT_000309 [Brettanomyces bruxellensis]|uniref:Major facilitator superfamily (MFS) profile domain-containing protein n=1 Tax=Dekkera bruxellensis TaxID=5007 RepID=A0A871R408_DEKBR|nr:uncharacterized protein BRETT_000309 [Brettanomyces bruxellensis]QOU20599.1 hypothetical protein BRETT_000309 [Brettanomyces bruxellensis]
MLPNSSSPLFAAKKPLYTSISSLRHNPTPSSDSVSAQGSARLAPSVSSTSSSAILEAQVKTPSRLVIILTFVASISGFLFGYDTGYVSSVLVSIRSDLGGTPLTIENQEWITSGASIGAFFASFLAGPLADYFGRRATVVTCDVLFGAGGILQFTASNLTPMVAGRLIMGLGIGFGSLIAPLYISELSPRKYRGRLVTVNCLAITAGQLVAYGAGAFFQRVNSGWRYTILLSLLPCCVQLITVLLLPDTPRYLIKAGRFAEAERVLRQVYTRSSGELIDGSIEELSALNSEQPSSTGFFGSLLTSTRLLLGSPSNQRALFIACGLQAAQQFVGFNAVMYFAATIFKMLGFANSATASCLVAATNFIFTGLAFLTIDRVGRRRMLLFTMPAVCVFQILCAVAFLGIDVDVLQASMQLTVEPKVEPIVKPTVNPIAKFTLIPTTSTFTVLSLIGFVAAYASGLGVVPWQQSEMFPQSVRGLGSAFATATNWFGSTVVSASFLTLMHILTPPGTFLLYAAVTALSGIAVYLTYPELGSLQLEEIGVLLRNGFNVRKSVEVHRERLA